MKKFIKAIIDGYEGSFDLNEVAAYHEAILDDSKKAPHTIVLLKSGTLFSIRGDLQEFRKDMEKYLKDSLKFLEELPPLEHRVHSL